MKTKKRLRREPSHSPQFIGTAILVMLVLFLFMILAKFTALKFLFWLD